MAYKVRKEKGDATFWLKEVDDAVELMAIDSAENEWTIGVISARGLFLEDGIDSGDIPTDDDGKIKIVD